MTLPDRIQHSVDAAVDVPVDAHDLLRQVHSRRHHSLAPLAAAAAVALVIGGTTVAIQQHQDGSTAQPGAASTVVPFTHEKPGEGDVPPPNFRVHGGPAPIMCGSGMLDATLAWQAHGDVLSGTIEIGLKEADPAYADCELKNVDPVVTVLGVADSPIGPASTYAGIPDAPLPPAVPRRHVGQNTPVLIPLTLTGSNCLSSNWGAVHGLSPEPFLRFLLENPRLPCDESRPAADGTLTIGVPHTKGQAAAPLPQDRKNLEVVLDLPDTVREHEPLRYTVRLINPTGQDISLAPCPSYQTAFGRVDSDSSTYFGSDGRLNCGAAPAAVPAGGEVAFAMEQDDLQSEQPGAKDAPKLSVQWGMAGPPAAKGDVPFERAGPTPAGESAAPSLADLFAATGEYPGTRWTRGGKEVPAQDLSLAQGPTHCQWERALFLGGAVLPVGSSGERLWTRDPEGVLTHFPRAKQEFEAHAALPADAADTGYRYGVVELWLAPSDDGEYVYLVNARNRSDVERWVRGGGGCA
jgi:hypothetical protein